MSPLFAAIAGQSKNARKTGEVLITAGADVNEEDEDTEINALHQVHDLTLTLSLTLVLTLTPSELQHLVASGLGEAEPTPTSMHYTHCLHKQVWH